MARQRGYIDILLLYVWLVSLLSLIASARPWGKPFKGYTGCPKEQLVLTGPGVISTPGYPEHYPPNTRCIWLIKAPKDTFITLQFSTLDVKSSPSCDVTRCQCSYVQIQSHQKGPRKYNKKYCEGHKPNGVISLTSNKVQVRFKSNSFAKGKGFALKYWFESRLSTNSKSQSAKQDSPYPPQQMTSHKVRRSVSNSSGVVVMYKEDKEKAKKQEEEADPPDEIVLGPSIPIILIFIGVVASIAWWQFRSDQKERLRYYKEQIRYEEISKRTKKRYKKKKQSMKEIRMKKLYGDMARHWQGTQGTQGGGSPNLSFRSPPRRTFAGRLLELAEKPVSYIRTPRSSRPSSVVMQEQEIPLVVMREKKADRPVGHQLPSRPASVLLRDALNMIFGATALEPGDAAKEPGSESDSKRASLKRVSFYDSLVEKMADVKEETELQQPPPPPPPPPPQQQQPAPQEQEAAKKPKPKPAPLTIPNIMVRQPSCDSADSDIEHKRSPIREIKISSISTKKKPPLVEEKKDEPQSEREVIPEESATAEQALPTDLEPMVDGKEPGSERPRSFEKKLVEMLESLKSEKEEFPDHDNNDDDTGKSFGRDYLDEPSPPPAPHQTPAPRDSDSSMTQVGKTNCADLEDFLLNLDKELEDQDND